MVFKIINGNGIIKEYDDKGILKYEGEYLNGVQKGKNIDYNSKLIVDRIKKILSSNK